MQSHPTEKLVGSFVCTKGTISDKKQEELLKLLENLEQTGEIQVEFDPEDTSSYIN